MSNGNVHETSFLRIGQNVHNAITRMRKIQLVLTFSYITSAMRWNSSNSLSVYTGLSHGWDIMSDTDELKNTEGRRWCRRRWLVALEDRRWAGSALTRVISLKTVVFGEEIPWQRRSTVFLGYQCFFEAMFVVKISLVTAALGNELTPILFVLTRYPVWLTGHP